MKGHWPKGRLRNDADPGEWPRLREDLSAFIEGHRRANVCSFGVLAAHVGVEKRTVIRWLTGEDWPPGKAVGRMRDWLRQVRAGFDPVGR